MEPDYDIVEQLIWHIRENRLNQPTLAELAAIAGLSESHLQRVFQRWSGVSPKRFLQHLTAGAARDMLRTDATVLDTAYEVGLSGPGRLHDLMVSVDAMTPGEIKAGGTGLTIHYGVHASPFGSVFIANTERGICAINFSPPEGLSRLEDEGHALPPRVVHVQHGGGEGLRDALLVGHGGVLEVALVLAVANVLAGDHVVERERPEGVEHLQVHGTRAPSVQGTSAERT